MRQVDIGVFAHDEVERIGSFLAALAEQDLFGPEGRRAGFAPRVVVLANGCTDGTETAARAALDAHPRLPGEVATLPVAGKSRTWEAFVHGVARREAEILVFCDADIELTGVAALRRLVLGLAASPGLAALSSRPVKDLALETGRLGPVAGLIRASAGELDDWRSAICGQLYAARAAALSDVHMPPGLPVEDGFLRAMLVTDVFTRAADPGRIDGAAEVSHVYPSERRIGALVRHQTRIVVGGAVNSAIFAHLNGLAPEKRKVALAEAAGREGWVADILAARLPRWPWGWVHPSFLVKRLDGRAGAARSPGGYARLLLGLGFDALVYLAAQIRMARGAAGYW
jgi:glycosyltransferase involved in cell wall biosynthesis